MRYNMPVSVIRLSILAVALWCGVLTASAQTTAFSYQGQLNDNGSPANGAYDMQFKLFDALNIGTQVGSTVTLTNVTVSNGVFTVTLDFGATAFPGANRWLEISVRLTGGGTFTTLTPRQPVTSTPYAIKSLNAASADGLSVACIGCVTSSQIGSLPTGSGNYIQNTTTQQASSNFNISGNGLIGGNVGIGTTSPLTKLDISGSQSLSNGMALSLFNANASNTNRWFLGTGGAFVDKSAFSIGDSSAIRMAILPNGNMGIGMVYPLAKLDVADGNIALNDGMLRLRNGLDANHGMLWTSTLDGTEFRGLGGFRWMTGSAGATERMRIESNGNVGIGTTSPLTKLDISGSDSLFNGVALSLFNSNASNTNRWVLGTGGVFVDKSAFSIGDSTAIRMAILSNGNVGIGTTNPGPKLAVAGLEASFHGKGAAIGLSNIATGGANWYLRAGATGTVTPAGGFSIADDIDYRLIINNSGNVGIGTTNPIHRLHVLGDRIRLENAGKQLDLRADGSAVDLQSVTNSLYISSLGPNGDNKVIINPFPESGNVGIGTTTPNEKLTVAGTVSSTSGGFIFPDGSLQRSAGEVNAKTAFFSRGVDSAGIELNVNDISVGYLDLSAGAYFVTANVRLRNAANYIAVDNARRVTCYFKYNASVAYDYDVTVPGQGGHGAATLSFHDVVNLNSPTRVDIMCWGSSNYPGDHSEVFAQTVRLSAIKVGTLTTQ